MIVALDRQHVGKPGKRIADMGAWGDLDGDGLADFGLSSEDEYGPEDDQGAIYLFTHLSTGTEWVDDAADIILRGDGYNSQLGADFDSLDVDGDGFSSCDDCDDTTAQLSPGNEELTCDGIEDFEPCGPAGKGAATAAGLASLRFLLLLLLLLSAT